MYFSSEKQEVEFRRNGTYPYTVEFNTHRGFAAQSYMVCYDQVVAGG